MAHPLSLAHISVSEMDNNCYLLHANNEGLLIDAADNAQEILELAHNAGVTITKVLTTHRHWDHSRALADVIKATGATHYAPHLDAPALPVPADVELHYGDTIEFAGHDLPIVILRGHTPGGAALIAPIAGTTSIFSGDSLFPGGLGKTSSESDFERLFHDVTKYIFDVYPDDSIVYPGHGKSTTLGEQRPQLDSWWERRW
ncbi:MULTISPECIES: MBL fold metallo-hydrolase [unclassified Corynebacterium]|uniref:MBL fold metallo-hydrolase n=1 Tax=Corynebacterium sp. sy017 TaxID=2499527 RepID=UPI00143D08A4|nr:MULTISPECIES: MBL fold metallo-hydrolase [unclassified Corynebacterium]